MDILNNINAKINAHANRFDQPYQTFAIFGVITYPLYYFIWAASHTQSYDSLWLRLIATLLCLILALKNYWPQTFKQFLPLYWYATLLYCLPFFFTITLLKNHISYDAALNAMTALVLCILLLDLLSLLIVVPLGILFGTSLYFVLDKQPLVGIDYKIILITYLSVIAFGALFAYRKDQLKEAKERKKEMEAEILRIEVNANKAKLEVQEKFTHTATQVAHDIRSPLASLLMIVRSCKEIPEQERVALREAASSIGDIANNLLSKYKSKDTETIDHSNELQAILISATLLQVLTDKKFQYKELPIKFDYDFNQTGQFSFIKIELSPFKRMISNLINNSVDAFENNPGEVTIKLDATEHIVTIAIVDNGKGIPAHVLEKILKNIAITEGKEQGHGIGLTQVRETLARSQGKISIDSTEGKGTTIKLEFPRAKALSWLAEEIKLKNNDMVIILDDEPSIHAAWDSRFETVMSETPMIQVKHFVQGKEALDFINNISTEELNNIFLLTDFELLKQELDGLHVVAKSGIQRSILVTSHYANAIVMERAAKLGTKILPKQLASEIPIKIEELIPTKRETQEVIVDLILVDDDKSFAENLISYVFENDRVVHYRSPKELKDNLNKYPKNTRIYLDNNFSSGEIQGVNVAKELHGLGYTKLYLLTGDRFEEDEIPDYIKVIFKTDLENIKDW